MSEATIVRVTAKVAGSQNVLEVHSRFLWRFCAMPCLCLRPSISTTLRQAAISLRVGFGIVQAGITVNVPQSRVMGPIKVLYKMPVLRALQSCNEVRG